MLKLVDLTLGAHTEGETLGHSRASMEDSDNTLILRLCNSFLKEHLINEIVKSCVSNSLMFILCFMNSEIKFVILHGQRGHEAWCVHEGPFARACHAPVSTPLIYRTIPS